MDNKGINVLSLFDGMSCGRIALERAGINVYRYYASEIDKHAIKVSLDNWFDVVQIGSVVDLHYKDGILFNVVTCFSVKVKIDLLIGGSPCQGFSFAGDQLNFEDPRSKLFFDYHRLWCEIEAYNPDAKFLLENVKMKKQYEAVISDYMFVNPIEINSALVSAQNRKRLYWTNIKGVNQPEDKGLVIGDIIDQTDLSSFAIYKQTRPRVIKNYRSENQKAFCMTATMYKGSESNGMTVVDNGYGMRCVNCVEAEALQTVPKNYTSSVSNTQRYKILGNGWTVDVIVHIFSFYKPC